MLSTLQYLGQYSYRQGAIIPGDGALILHAPLQSSLDLAVGFADTIYARGSIAGYDRNDKTFAHALTGVPRLDPAISTYRPGGYVVEPQTAHLGASLIPDWLSGSGASVLTPSSEVAPDGSLNATLVTAGVEANHRVTGVNTDGLGYTVLYAKAGSSCCIGLGVAGFGVYAVFDLLTCSISYQAGGSLPTISALGNGWCRIAALVNGIPVASIWYGDTPALATPGAYYDASGQSVHLWATHRAAPSGHRQELVSSATPNGTKAPDALQYLNIQRFPTSELVISCLFAPLDAGNYYQAAEFVLFRSLDSRGAANELTTQVGAAYGFTHLAGGGVFTLAASDIFASDYTFWGFSLTQIGANIDWAIFGNGLLVASGTLPGSLDHSNLAGLQVGYNNSDYNRGRISDLRVYNSISAVSAVLSLATVPMGLDSGAALSFDSGAAFIY